MRLDKVYEMHPDFREWVRSHRHSTRSVERALEDAIESGTDNPVEVLQSYLTVLTELRDEIRGEISEARDWVTFFKKQKR